MTAEERRELIMRPFPVVRVIPSAYPWAGVLISEPELTPEKVLMRAGEWVGPMEWLPKEKE